MTSIKAILVDDEPKALSNLSLLIKEYCSGITIVGAATSVDDAVILIESMKPDVVFLDIEMPEKSGFQIFEETNIDFQTIFVTAYDDYAVKAFEVSAIDYLLKPIDIHRLREAVSKLGTFNYSNTLKYKTLKENLKSNTISQIIVPYKDSKRIISIKDIICFEASQSYCYIYVIENNIVEKLMYSKSLKYFDDILQHNTTFFRSNRSWLINIKKVKSYSKRKSCIYLDNEITVLLSKSKIKLFEAIMVQNS